jgi:hypothetical protein
MSTPAPGKNGKGKAIQCPNSEACVVAQSAADTLSLIDARLSTLGTQLHQVALHLSEVSERQTRGDQREAEWLAQVAEIARAVRRLAPEMEG